MLNALNRLAGEYDSRRVTARRELTIAENQLRDYQARLGKPFAHESYMERLNSLRDQLKRGLSGSAPAEGAEEQPNTAELAEQIKALRAGQTVESAPQRVARTRASAEESVTAKIRRRTEAAAESGATAGASDPTQQERITPERFISRNDAVTDGISGSGFRR